MYFIEDNTMEKSNTIDKKVIDQAINDAVNSVKRFTKKELYKLIQNTNSSRRPLIIPVGELGFIVGDYAVKEYKSLWYVTYIYNIEKDIVFSSRHVAVIYALCQTKKQYNQAQAILTYDNDVVRLQQEINLFTERTRNALRQKNLVKHGICISRLTELQHLIKHKQALLTKSLKMAKYNYL